jgi:hypothetical protein
MEFLLIAVVCSWCMRSWWEGRKADYRNPASAYQNAVQDRKHGREVRQMRGVQKRNGLGWGLWQLRHGWAPMAQDVRDGWNDAQKARGTGAFDDMTIGQAAKAAWQAAKPKAMPDETTPDLPTPPAPPVEPAVEPQATAPAAPNQPSAPQPTGAPTVTDIQTSEVNNLDALREYLKVELGRATTRLERAHGAVAGVQRSISNHDAVYAQLVRAGLGPQTTEPLTALMESAQGRLARNQALAAAAEQDIAVAERALGLLVTQGHQSVQEAVGGATAPVAKDTSFYQPV